LVEGGLNSLRLGINASISYQCLNKKKLNYLKQLKEKETKKEGKKDQRQVSVCFIVLGSIFALRPTQSYQR